MEGMSEFIKMIEKTILDSRLPPLEELQARRDAWKNLPEAKRLIEENERLKKEVAKAENKTERWKELIADMDDAKLCLYLLWEVKRLKVGIYEAVKRPMGLIPSGFEEDYKMGQQIQSRAAALAAKE